MLDELDRKYGIENEYDIIFGDYFYLKYETENVFLFVCNTTSNQVCVYELAKRKAKLEDGTVVEKLYDGFKPSRKPIIVKENNCCSKSDFWCDIKDKEHIYVPVNEWKELEAIKMVDEKEYGVLNFYWEL